MSHVVSLSINSQSLQSLPVFGFGLTSSMDTIDTEIEIENVIPSSMPLISDVQSEESSISNERYRPSEIEKLLKLSIESKQCIVVRNSSSFIKSEVWNMFGFPVKQQSDGTYRSIVGYVSCFHCYKTMLYESSSTQYMNKHQCHVRGEENVIEKTDGQITLDKYVRKKVIIQKNDREKFKEKLVLWACSSLRPFNMFDDDGFIDVILQSLV